MFGEESYEMKALLVANKLINIGKIVENCVLSTKEEAISYAQAKNIREIQIVSADITKITIDEE